jgi:hypothetical protein
MKCFSPLALTLALFLQAPKIDQKAQAPHNTNKPAQKPEPSEPPLTTEPGKVAQPAEPTKADGKGKERSYLGKILSPEVLPNWLLFVVGTAGIIFAYRTLRTIEAQVNEMKNTGSQNEKLIAQATEHAAAARTTAEAALANAQAVINAERAWILVEMRRVGHESFALSLRNHGRTPAEVRMVKHLETWIPPSETLRPEADFRWNQSEQFMQVRMLPPGERWEPADYATTLGTVLPDEILQEVRKNRKRYFIYGKVEYRDLVQLKDRESRFCFFYSARLDDFVIGGPPECTCYT